MIDRWLHELLRQTTRHPKPMWAGLIVVTLIATLLWPRFSIEPDVSQLLPESNDVVRLSRLVEKRVDNPRQLMVIVEADDVASQLPDLVERLRSCPHLMAVEATREEFIGEQAAQMREAPLYHVPQSTRDALSQRMREPAARRGAIADAKRHLADNPLTGRDVILADPLGLRWLTEASVRDALPFRLDTQTPYVVLEGGRRALLRVTGREPPSDFTYTRSLIDDLEQRLGSVQHQLVGTYATTYAHAQRINSDLKRSTLLTVVLVGLFLLVAMRRVGIAILVLLPIALAVYWTLPLAGAVLGPLTLLTIGAAAILVGLGVDFTIHYLVSYLGHRRRSPHAQALEQTSTTVGRPLVASMLTTVAAFSVLAFAHFSGLRVFGLLLAAGLFLALASTLVSLPLLLRWHQPRASDANPEAEPSLFDRFAATVFGRGAAVLLLVASVMGAVFTATRGIDFSSDLRYLRPSEDAVADAERHFERQFGFSLSPAVLLVPQTKPLSEVKAAVEQLEEDGWIAWSTGPHLNHSSTATNEAVAQFHHETRGWIAATLDDLDAAGLNAEPFRPGLEAIADKFARAPASSSDEPSFDVGDERYTLLLCHPPHEWLTQRDWQQFIAAAKTALGDDIRAYHTLTILDEIHAVIGADMKRMVLIAAALIAVVLIMLCGGPGAAALALLPAVGGLSITLGVMAGFQIPLNMGNCICIPFLLGMGVDGGVHVVHRVRATGDLRLGSCGVAIWRTSATSMLAFLALASADTPVVASIGQLGAIGVAASFLCCMILLPVLLGALPERYRPCS